jgi:hypothetical protein
MNKAVTHPGHGTPFYMAIPLLDVVRKLFHCFPNDLWTPNKCALQRFIVQKGLFLQPLHPVQEILGLGAYVLEIGSHRS